MKTLTFFIALFICQLKIVAQNTIGGVLPSETPIAIGTLNMDDFRAYNIEYDDVNGSPYLEDDFLNGYVILFNKNRSEDLKLQFDIYSNEFFYINEDGTELVINQKMIREIIMAGQEESYLLKRVNHKNPLKFYDVFYDSESLILYRDLDINFYEAKNTGITQTAARFSRTDKYYVLQKGKEPKRIKLKRKELLKFFTKEDCQLMDKILKEQKLKLKSSKDFKELFNLMKGK